MSAEEQEADDNRRVAAAVRILSEHFDAVQIFASRHEAGTLDGTVSVATGSGNWFARLGQVRVWMTRQDEHDRCNARRETNL